MAARDHHAHQSFLPGGDHHCGHCCSLHPPRDRHLQICPALARWAKEWGQAAFWTLQSTWKHGSRYISSILDELEIEMSNNFLRIERNKESPQDQLSSYGTTSSPSGLCLCSVYQIEISFLFFLHISMTTSSPPPSTNLFLLERSLKREFRLL